LDFGLIVDGAVIISENALRRTAERQHPLARLLTLPERLQEHGCQQGNVSAHRFRANIIITVYLPQLTFTRIEGKMFEPMALTVIIALVTAFILSLTFVPAMLVTGPAQETENLPSAPTSAAMSRFCVVRYEIRPLSSGPPWHFSFFPFPFHAAWPGVHSDARRRGSGDARHAHQHCAFPVHVDAVAGRTRAACLAQSRVCFFQDRYGGHRIRSDAAACLRYLHHPQAKGGLA
jgi:AcrB/AcrD/AcrF family